MSLLNIIKIIRRYNTLKIEELKIRSRLFKAIKDLNITIKKTESTFPFIKIPQKIKREDLNKEKITIITQEKFDADLEAQLKDIQSRLRAMER